METPKNQLAEPVGMLPLIVVVLTTGFACMLIAQYIRSKIIILDTPANIAPITLAEFADRNLPTIQTGLYIRDFNKFDMDTGDFAINGVIWFQFDPELVSLDTISQFSIENGSISYKSTPVTQLRTDGTLFVRYDIQAEFKNAMNYHFFPFDDHSVSLVIVNKYLSLNDALVVSNDANFFIATNMERQGWHMEQFGISFGYRQELFDITNRTKNALYPATAYIMNYQRNDVRVGLVIFLPLLVLFFIGCIPFALSRDDQATGAGLGIVTASITGTLGYRLVIDSVSPTVGYFMTSDYIFLVFLTLGFIIFLIHLLDWQLNRKQRIYIMIAAHSVVIATFSTILILEHYI